MNNNEQALTQKEYKEYRELFLKYFDDKTMTSEEFAKLKAYEKKLKPENISEQGMGTALSYSTPSGRALSEEDKRQAGIASALLIVFGVIVAGIAAAFILLKM